MADIEIISDWLKKADEDFQFAVVNLREQKPFYAQICFHFHQAAEKGVIFCLGGVRCLK